MKSKFREYMWLVISIICIIAGTHQTFVIGINESYVFFILAALSLLLFTIRRNLRKNRT